MKIDIKIWIPIIGILFAKDEPLLLFHETWIKYQVSCMFVLSISFSYWFVFNFLNNFI